MSHSRSTSRTRVYDVVERDELRIDTSQPMLSPTLSLPSRTRSCSTRRPSNDGRDCIPCNMVRPSSTLRKRLIVCCDGTFCAADKGKENNPTNITRLSRVIANTGLDSQDKYIAQIVNYQSGVGTGKLTKFNKDLQGIGSPSHLILVAAPTDRHRRIRSWPDGEGLRSLYFPRQQLRSR